MFFSDGIPIVYAGQEQHYSGGADPANREAVWLSGYSTSATLYSWIASTNKIRKLAISKDSAYITSKVFPVTSSHSTANIDRTTRSTMIPILSLCARAQSLALKSLPSSVTRDPRAVPTPSLSAARATPPAPPLSRCIHALLSPWTRAEISPCQWYPACPEFSCPRHGSVGVASAATLSPPRRPPPVPPRAQQRQEQHAQLPQPFRFSSRSS